MNGTLVLDASASLAVALHEPGGDSVLTRMRSAKSTVIHASNAFEVAYKLMVQCVPEESAWRLASCSGAAIIGDTGGDIATRALRIKISALFLSMADCYCLALAEVVGGTVLTSDRGFTRAKTSADVVLFR